MKSVSLDRTITHQPGLRDVRPFQCIIWDATLSFTKKSTQKKKFTQKRWRLTMIEEPGKVGPSVENEYGWEYAHAVADAEIRRAAVRAATALGSSLGPGTHTSAAGNIYVVADSKSRMRVLRNYVPVVGPLLTHDQPSISECWALLEELGGISR